MPIYTYHCGICAKDFDILVGVNQEKYILKCPHCHSSDVKRVFTSFRIGSGRSSRENTSSKCSSCSGGSCATCGG